MTGTAREELRDLWRERLKLWREGDLSGAAFCREHDLSIYQFRYWVRRIAELDANESGGFARVTAPGSGIRLVLPGGLRVEVEPGFDEATLKRFLRTAAAC